MLSNRVYPVCRLTVANRSPPWFCRASKGVFRTGFPSAHICIRAVGVPVLGRNPARYVWFSGASNPFEVLLKRARNRAIVHRRIAAGQDREKTAAIGASFKRANQWREPPSRPTDAAFSADGRGIQSDCGIKTVILTS